MYTEFKDLEITKKSRHLIREIYVITNGNSFGRDYSLKDQIRRASVSVLSNIAEGKGRGSKKDFAKFLYISRGSCTEIRAQLLISYDLEYISEIVFTELDNECIEIIKMLTSLINHLY